MPPLLLSLLVAISSVLVMSLSAWMRPRQAPSDSDNRASGGGSASSANKASGANVEKLRKYFQLAKVPLATMRRHKYMLCLEYWLVTCVRVVFIICRTELRNQHMRTGGRCAYRVCCCALPML